MAQKLDQRTVSEDIMSAIASLQPRACEQISLRALLQLPGPPTGKPIHPNAPPLIELTLAQDNCYNPDLGYDPLSADLTPEQEGVEAARCKTAAVEIFGAAALAGHQNKDEYPFHLVPMRNYKEDIDFGLTGTQFDDLIGKTYGDDPEEQPMDADTLGDDISLGSQCMDASSLRDDISLEQTTMDTNYPGENISDEHPRKRSKSSLISLQAEITSQESKSTYNKTAGFEGNKEREAIPPTTTKKTDTLRFKKSVKNVFAAVARRSPNPSSPSNTSSSLPRPVVLIAPRPSQGPSTPTNTSSIIPKPVHSIAGSSQDPWSPFNASLSAPSGVFWNPQPVQSPAPNPVPQSSFRSKPIDSRRGQTPTHGESQSVQRLLGPTPPPQSSSGSKTIDSHEPQNPTHRELQFEQRPLIPTPSPQGSSANRPIETLEARAPTQRELKRWPSHQRHRSSPSNSFTSANSVQPSFSHRAGSPPHLQSQSSFHRRRRSSPRNSFGSSDPIQPSFSHRAGSPPHSQAPQLATSLFGSSNATYNSFKGPSTPTHSGPQYYNHNRSGSSGKMSDQSTPTQESSSPTPRKSLLPPPHPSLPPRPAGPLPSFTSQLSPKLNHGIVPPPATTTREYASIEFSTRLERQEAMKRLQGIGHNQEVRYKVWRANFPKYTEMRITCDTDPKSKKIELNAPKGCNVRGALNDLFERRYHVSARHA